jgi:hypothetical protein
VWLSLKVSTLSSKARVNQVFFVEKNRPTYDHKNGPNNPPTDFFRLKFRPNHWAIFFKEWQNFSQFGHTDFRWKSVVYETRLLVFQCGNFLNHVCDVKYTKCTIETALGVETSNDVFLWVFQSNNVCPVKFTANKTGKEVKNTSTYFFDWQTRTKKQDGTAALNSCHMYCPFTCLLFKKKIIRSTTKKTSLGIW